jgi:hypothetical protein
MKRNSVHLFLMLGIELLIYVGVCCGYLNRDLICVEQSNFCQAMTNQVRGINIWTPVGDKSSDWMFFELSVHNKTADGVDCYDNPHAYFAQCAPGVYIVPLVSSSGLSFPNGNWSSGLASNGWRYISNYTITNRNMRLTVPTGTTRLYMNALSGSTFGTMNITVISGSADLIKTQWNLNSSTGTDFTGKREFIPVSQRPNYFTWDLIATNCGGAVLDFIGNGGTPDAINCAGFICVMDGGSPNSANPFDGVFIPSTLYEITPYKPGGQGQIAEGPISLKFSSGRSTAFWWGLGHWATSDAAADPDDTLINEVESLYYETDAGIWVNWTTVNTADTWVRAKAKSFSRVLQGDMQTDVVDDNTLSSATRFTFGTYSGTYLFTASGMSVILDHQFNSAAASNGLQLAGSIGGYGGQWSIAKSQVRQIRVVPAMKSTEIYVADKGAYTNQETVLTKQGGIGLIYGNRGTALFTGETVFLTSGGAIISGSPSLMFVERSITSTSTPNEFMKIYMPIMSSGSDVPLSAGDRLLGRHTRTWTVPYGIEVPNNTVKIIFSN